MQQRRSLVLSLLATTIVAAGGGGAGVASHLLHRDNIGTGVKKVPDKASEVGCKRLGGVTFGMIG